MSLFDYVLMNICVCLPIFATANSLRVESEGLIMMLLVVLGTSVSYSVSRLDIKHPLLRWDGVAYCIVAIFAFTQVQLLDTWMTYDVFVGPVTVAGGMIWMMVFGSFVAWRDGTLLFQTVPSLALFSLVGVWDIYKPAALLFFAYLLCFAVLMGRIHNRLMVRMAVDSGYQQYDRLKEGVWRWAAGPEWALGSGFAVILLSLIGAPLIQKTIKPLSPAQKFNPPTAPSQSPALLTPENKELRVGNGPRSLSDQYMFAFEAREPMYLRSECYYVYTGSGWTNSVPKLDLVGYDRLGRQSLTNFRAETYAIELPRGFDAPIPGVVSGPAKVRLNDRHSTMVAYQTLLPDLTKKPGRAGHDLGNYRGESAAATQAIQELVRSTTAGATSDFEKALLLKQAITSRVKYNLQAPPVPNGKDPVEYFLTQGKEGYCDLFATSMAVLARETGIPSRYVVGYLPETISDKAANVRGLDRFDVLQKDAHAWAELYFEGFGWVVFDATEGAQQTEGGKRGSTYSPPLSKWAIAGIALTLVGGIAFGVRAALQFFKRTKKAKSLRTEIGRQYGRFEGLLSRGVGHVRRLSETPQEYLALAAPQLKSAYPTAKELTKQFEHALYAVVEPSDEEVQNLKSSVDQFSKVVRKEKVEPPKRTMK